MSQGKKSGNRDILSQRAVAGAQLIGDCWEYVKLVVAIFHVTRTEEGST